MLTYKNRTEKMILLLCLTTVLLSQGVQLTRIARSPVISLTPTPIPTATPWVKQDVLVMMRPSGLEVWTDNAEVDRLVIDRVDGVVNTTTYSDGYMIYVRVDPRYDKALVAEAIINQLTKSTTRQERGMQ